MTIPLPNSIDSAYDRMVVRPRTKKARRGRPKELENAVSVTFDMERSQSDSLREVADEKGVSAAALIRKAIAAYLRRLGRS